MRAPAACPRLLVIDAVTPDRTRDSGSVRLMAIFELLAQQGFQVTFMPDSGRASTAEAAALAAQGVELIGTGGRPDLPDWLRRNAGVLAGALLCRHYVAAHHLGLIRHFAPSATVALDTVDLHFVRERRTATLSGNRRARASAARTRRRELRQVRACDATFVVSGPEQRLLHRLLPDARIRVLSNIHPLLPCRAGPDGRAGMLFVGGFGHPPNRDAVHWLVEEILPRVRQQVPDMPLHLVGDIPDADATALRRPGVVVHGRIDDLGPLMAHARMAVAPLRAGAGVKGKVNSAMSHGLPVVVTPIAAEGMFIEDGEQALVADGTGPFAAAVVRLDRDDTLWQRLSDAGRENIRRHFSAENAAQVLAGVFPSRPG
ncbi:glycosyltransferase family 4 protein [Stenotrophomonas mori]|nr:glycosyltransferase [Stenotrophomonas mori]